MYVSCEIRYTCIIYIYIYIYLIIIITIIYIYALPTNYCIFPILYMVEIPKNGEQMVADLGSHSAISNFSSISTMKSAGETNKKNANFTLKSTRTSIKLFL